jgi:hypothetical protein
VLKALARIAREKAGTLDRLQPAANADLREIVGRHLADIRIRDIAV